MVSSTKPLLKSNFIIITKPRASDSHQFLHILMAVSIILCIYYVIKLSSQSSDRESVCCLEMRMRDTRMAISIDEPINDENKNTDNNKIENKNNVNNNDVNKGEVIINQNTNNEIAQQIMISEFKETLSNTNDVMIDDSIASNTLFATTLSTSETDTDNSNTNANKNNNNKNNWMRETRGKFSVIRNYIESDDSVDYNSSVTLTTQSTYEFLKHSQELCRRWDGHVSISVYSPGDDFVIANSVIQYMRQCSDPCVRKNISWHLVYDTVYEPMFNADSSADEYDCATDSVESVISRFNGTFRKNNRLTYPINVMRNVARLSAKTRYVFASDIELYPSENIVTEFLKLVAREKQGLVAKINNKMPHVYVVPIFEVNEGVEPPLNKNQLRTLIKQRKAIFFHKLICDVCQRFPGRDKWLASGAKDNSLDVFQVTRRTKTHHSWEPLFIGTNSEPLYEESLTWEGKRDKMLQMYEMCLLSYQLVILDNAFLVHASGIKRNVAADHRKRIPFVIRNNRVEKQRRKQLQEKYRVTANSDC